MDGDRNQWLNGMKDVVLRQSEYPENDEHF